MTKNKPNIKPYLLQFYLGNIGYLLISMIQTLILTATSLLTAWVIQQIIDILGGVDTGFTLSQLVIGGIVSIALTAIAYGFSYFSKPYFISKASAQYKNFVFSKLIEKGISAFSGENTASYISALSNDVNTIETDYLYNIFTIIDMSALFCGALAMMIWYSPILTLLAIAIAMLPLIASICTGNLIEKAQRKVSDSKESYMSALHDTLFGFSVIKSFRAERQICNIFAKEVRNVADATKHRWRASVIVSTCAVITSDILQLGVMLIGAYLAFSGKSITAGTVLVFVQLLNYVVNPIGVIPQALAECKASKALITKLAESLASNVRKDGEIEKNDLQDAITIKNLTFAYEENKNVLDNLNFSFEAGKSYCLVGTSGSGKSTLLDLLMASHHEYSGSINYDETELKSIRSEALYDMISVIQQNVFIFNASIRDNITMFSDFSDEAVDKAIEMSGLAELIRDRGEDYLCGENGSGLSGGEKQRISIARSLLKKSPVLLVDEATASLDTQTAAQVTSAILGLDGITRIIVTHALDETLLKQYDCILALKNGHIAESGRFDELMSNKGYFYSLFTVAQ